MSVKFYVRIRHFCSREKPCDNDYTISMYYKGCKG